MAGTGPAVAAARVYGLGPFGRAGARVFRAGAGRWRPAPSPAGPGSMNQAPSLRGTGRRGRGPAVLLAAAALAGGGAHAGAPPPDAPPLPGPACVDGFGRFGTTVELSADGALLAVGAPHDSNANAAAGALHPGDPGFAEAMAGIREEDLSETSGLSFSHTTGEHSVFDRETGEKEETLPGWRYYSGAVHVFRLGASGRWEPEAYLKAAEPAVNGMLGGALAMDAAGDTLAAGPGPHGMATFEGDIGDGARGASVFRRSASGRWAPEARLEPRKRGRDDRFGWSLALSGDGSALAAGAKWSGPGGAGGSVLTEPSDSINLQNKGEHDAPGAVYVYRRSASGRWALEALIEAPAPGAGDEFGEAVALDGPGAALAVGAGAEDGSAAGARMAGDPGLAGALADEGAPDSGAAYVFRRSAPGRWALEAYVKAPAPGRGDWFGSAVSLDAAGEALAVAAPREGSAASGSFRPGGPLFGRALADEGFPDAGAAYLYRRGRSGRWALEAYAKAPGGAGRGFPRSKLPWSPPDWDWGSESWQGGAKPALALSADGAALAASAPHGAGASAGLGGAPDGRCGLGAAQVHRRGRSGDWSLAAWTGSSCPPDGHGAERLADDVALSAGGLLAMGVADAWRGSACALRVAREAEAHAAWAPPAPPARPWPRGVSAYVKAPAPFSAQSERWPLPWYQDQGGRFGRAVALAGGGSALAVAGKDPSTATGVFHPGDPGFGGAGNARGTRAGPGHPERGFVLVHRRAASGRWAPEAYVKAPAPDKFGSFGAAVALSADGRTLAAGESGDDSAASGALHPGDAGFAAALAGKGAFASGGAYAYRRSASGRWALEAYVKAPAPGVQDNFGSDVALSADGGTLAAGASGDDSAEPGVLHPGDERFAGALAGSGAEGSGAAYVYRRSASGRWAPEAYAKTPAPGKWDRFGAAVALSADGGTLAAGASGDDSAAAGALHPGDAGFAAALAGEGAEDSGVACVYRRSASGRWALEACAKAPAPGVRDGFGEAVALSADGRTLAVGAPGDDSAAAGVLHPGDEGLAEALAGEGAEDSGAACVYRRSASGRWALEACAKAPAPGVRDGFGETVALGGGGGALAVGAPGNDSAASGAFHLGDEGFAEAPGGGGARHSGAAYVYRRGPSGRWALGAFAKAPVPGEGDRFGLSVSLGADGGALAAGAPGEDGGIAGVLHPADPGFREALAKDSIRESGAAYLYELRR